MSQRVQSNTMGHVRDQIARIQQQVKLQKEKARINDEQISMATHVQRKQAGAQFQSSTAS